MQRLIDRILARPGLVIRPFDMKNFFAEASLVRELYNDCWSENWGFIPMDDEDFAYMAKDMKSMVDPDFLLIAEMEGKPIGFSLTIPDFNQALQPLKGKLLPFGWLKFLLGKRKINYARTLLMGVLPEYRKLGVDMAMVYRTMQAGFAKGITSGECSWILADNVPMNRILRATGRTCTRPTASTRKRCGDDRRRQPDDGGTDRPDRGHRVSGQPHRRRPAGRAATGCGPPCAPPATCAGWRASPSRPWRST